MTAHPMCVLLSEVEKGHGVVDERAADVWASCWATAALWYGLVSALLPSVVP